MPRGHWCQSDAAVARDGRVFVQFSGLVTKS
jgi:hypothetical protein